MEVHDEPGISEDADLLQFVEDSIVNQPQLFINLVECNKRRAQRQLMNQEKKRRVPRARCPDYWKTNWGRMLLDPRSSVEGTFEYKRFRNKFRMPCNLFRGVFMDEIRSNNVFGSKYRSLIPLEIKCMIGLRILGRGSCADDMEEMSEVKASTINGIFHAFIKGVANTLFKKYVTPPVGDHLKRVMNTYARLGFPGAVGSVDCTHIFWSKCPVPMTNLCTGKEKFPSLSFEVVVDHERRIHSC